MAEYKYTIEVTLRSEVPKVDKPQAPQVNPTILNNLMPIILDALKNVQVKQIPSEKEEVEKK